jgi:hypothetical protein
MLFGVFLQLKHKNKGNLYHGWSVQNGRIGKSNNLKFWEYVYSKDAKIYFVLCKFFKQKVNLLNKE